MSVGLFICLSVCLFVNFHNRFPTMNLFVSFVCLCLCLFAQQISYQNNFLSGFRAETQTSTPCFATAITLFPPYSRDSLSRLAVLLSFLIRCGSSGCGTLWDILLMMCRSGLSNIQDCWREHIFMKIKSPTVLAQLYVNIFITIETQLHSWHRKITSENKTKIR